MDFKPRPWMSLILFIVAIAIYTLNKPSDLVGKIELFFLITWGMILISFELLKIKLLAEKYSENSAYQTAVSLHDQDEQEKQKEQVNA